MLRKWATVMADRKDALEKGCFLTKPVCLLAFTLGFSLNLKSERGSKHSFSVF